MTRQPHAANTPSPVSAPLDMPPSAPQPSTAGLLAARRTRAVAVATALALIVLCVGWELFWAPLQAGGSVLLALKALPLVLALPGLMRMRMYTYRWLSLLVWAYFTEGVVRAASDAAPSWQLALLEVALAVLMFITCVLHVRLRQKWAASPPSDS